MGIVAAAGRSRVGPPQIISMSLGDASNAQEGSVYSNTPTVIRGRAPLSFSGTGLPFGLTANSSTGVIGGTPAIGDYYGLLFNSSLAATDALSRVGSRNITISVYKAPALLFEPNMPSTFSGNSGFRGLDFFVGGTELPTVSRVGGAFTSHLWWGNGLGAAGFPGRSQFEARATLVSGTIAGAGSVFNVWHNLSATPTFLLDGAGSFTVELRPVSGAVADTRTFTFNN